LKPFVVLILVIGLLVSCNTDSSTSQPDSEYVEAKLSSMSVSLAGGSSGDMISEKSNWSIDGISSEGEFPVSSEFFVSLSSSSFLSAVSVSSEVIDPLSVLFQKFPISTVKPDASFDLEWMSSGSSNRRVNLYMSVNKGEFELMVQALGNNEYKWVLEGLKNGDRVQLKIEIYEPLALSDTLWDQTGIFDIHSGVTLLDYKNDIQPIVNKYCVNCHGGSST
jgi:hypothetical protein